ncbi:MAG: hypothetical protein M0Q40_09130 [Limnochordia bacterium]|nr:hypothetical protein [Limnochordia bacterium]
MRKLIVPTLVVLTIVGLTVCSFAKEVDLFDLMTGDWEALPHWISVNDTSATDYSVDLVSAPQEVSEFGVAWRFQVNEANTAMKWSTPISLNTKNTPYLSLAYRASGINTEKTGVDGDDWFVFIYGAEFSPMIGYLYELVADGEWHTLVFPVPELTMMFLDFHVKASSDVKSAFIEVADIRLVSEAK